MPRPAVLLLAALLSTAGCGEDEDGAAACREDDGLWECEDDVAQSSCRCAAR